MWWGVDADGNGGGLRWRRKGAGVTVSPTTWEHLERRDSIYSVRECVLIYM